ncbi:MAG: efflux RND transporter periplasmic adaptor subunit, partial [Planctomycetes bacterium]|nr:efflux RND transporter periplasmic adaptor subunit [Planctomycetota bacterium]
MKLVLILGAIGILIGVGRSISGGKEEIPPAEVPPVNVSTITVTAEPVFSDSFELPAVVEPNRVVEVSAEVDGRVEWIGPQKGAYVRTGDSLIRLNTELLQAQFEMAQAQAKNSQTEFERIKGLVAEGASPSRDRDAAATQLAINQAQLEQARFRLTRAHITAPMTGTLNNIPVEEGEYVTVMPQTTVAEIVDTATVKVAVEVPERDVLFFAVGQKAEVCLDVKGCQQSQTGTITFLSELADPRTRSTRMEITLPNPDDLLRSGQIVRVRLTRRTFEKAILIPLLAVIPMENSKTVYVVDESSRAQRRDVELGLIRADQIQVTGGLKPGDQLVVSGHRFVAPGQIVNVVPPGGGGSSR